MEYRLNLNIIDGVPFEPFISKERIEELKSWQILPEDLFIVTYPKSGTTWTQQIVKLIKNNGVDDGVKVSLTIPWLERDAEQCKVLPPPRTFHNHTVYRLMPGGLPAQTPAKYIYVARNPKDTAVSMYHHLRAFEAFEFDGPWDWFLEQYMQGKAEAGSWFDHVLEWWDHKDAPNILFLKYEDMKRDPHQAVRSIASFIGHNLEPQVVESIARQTSFQGMKSNPSTNYQRSGRHADATDFLRKGIVGDWKNYFTVQQNLRFDELYRERMKGTGLDFEFEPNP